MLERQQTSVEDQEQDWKTAPSAQDTSSTLPPATEALIARYAMQQEADEQSAVRARLEEVIAAYLELDTTPAEAARLAIQQLESEQIAAQQQREAAKQQAFRQRPRSRTAKHSARPATILALKLFGCGSLALIASFLAIILTLPEVTPASARLVEILSLFLYFGLPIVLGLIVGRRARHRPGLGTFYAIGMLSPFVAIVSEAVLRIFANITYGAWAIGLQIALIWLPIGVTTAALTGWNRDFRRKRRQEIADRAGRGIPASRAEF